MCPPTSRSESKGTYTNWNSDCPSGTSVSASVAASSRIVTHHPEPSSFGATPTTFTSLPPSDELAKIMPSSRAFTPGRVNSARPPKLPEPSGNPGHRTNPAVRPVACASGDDHWPVPSGMTPLGSPTIGTPTSPPSQPWSNGNQAVENAKLASGLEAWVPARPVVMSRSPLPKEPSVMLYDGPEDDQETPTVGKNGPSPSPQSTGPFCRAVGITTPKLRLGRQAWLAGTDAALSPNSIKPWLRFSRAATGSPGERRNAISPRLYRLTDQRIGPCPSRPVTSTLPLKVVLPFATTLTPVTDVLGNAPGNAPPSGTVGVGPAGAPYRTPAASARPVENGIRRRLGTE